MKIQSALTATALAGLLVLGTDYLSFAATGGSFILGHVNKAGQPSSLTNTGSGPALKLNTSHPGTTPALAVNSHIKVANLNADLLDGKNASALGVRTRVYNKDINVTGASNFGMTLSSVPGGTYLTSMNAWIYGPTTSTIECYVNVPSTGKFLEDWRDPSPSGFYVMGQAGVLTVPSTQDLTVNCNVTNGNYHTFSGQPLQVSLTRIDQITRINPAAPSPKPALQRAGR